MYKHYPMPAPAVWLALTALFGAPWAQSLAAEPEPFVGRAQITSLQLAEAVLARNPDLPARQAAWQAAQARVAQASALEDPRLSYGFAPDTRDVPGLDFGQKIQLSQRLPWPGKRRLRGQAARHEADAVREAVEATRLKLVAAAKAAHANWFYVYEAIRINRVNQELWTGFRAVAKLRYANGSASKQDALRAEVEHDKLELRAIVLERKRREAQSAINALLNRAPDRPVPPPASLASPDDLPDAEQLRATALDARPQLRALAARIQAAQSRVDLARRNFYPDFKATVGYSSLWNQDAKRTTVGVGINIPLNRAKRHAAEREARAGLKRLEWELARQTTEVAEQVQRTYDQVQESAQALALYRERLLPVTKDNLEAAIADYQSGAGDFLTLVTVEKNLMDIELQTQRTLADYHRRLARLERLVGRPLVPASGNEPLEQKPL